MRLMFPELNPKTPLPEIEQEVLEFWQKHDCFAESLKRRQGNPEYSFYDGPPFATGLPHYGHILAGAIKDIVPRYQTMRGKYVPRRFGWDCHGVPIEHMIEKKLGLKNADDIEKIGLKKFNEACRGAVLKHTSDWKKVVERMGRWVDIDNAYHTMDTNYMESIIWVFNELWQKGLIYEGKKVVSYSPKLASSLSNFEANLNYKDIHDPAVFVKFELEPNTYLLAWTTTPWTLISNVALGVGRDIKYSKITADKVNYIVASDCATKLFGEEIETIEIYSGQELVKKYNNQNYKPLFDYFKRIALTIQRNLCKYTIKVNYLFYP